MVSKSTREKLITAPSFLWLLIFFLVPTLIIYAFALKPANFYGGVEDGWSFNAIKNLGKTSYFIILWRTLLLSFVTTLICILLALPISYYIARASQRVQSLLILLVVLPFWSSFIIRIYAWKSLLHPEGFVKHLLVKLHLISENTLLLYQIETVLLVMVYSYLPFAILPIYSAASKFNLQLFEAAMDLGMNRIQTFYKVFIPGIRKGIFTAIIMVFIPAVGAYVIPDLVGGTKTEMIGNKIVQKTFIDRNLPQASALSALLSFAVVIPIGALSYYQYYTEKRRRTPKKGAYK